MATILVTGATGGLGRAVIELATRRGWNVLAPSRAECDTASDASVRTYFEEHARSTDISAIVHLVGGIVAGRSVEETTDADVEHMLSLNLVSAFNMVRHGMPILKARGGGAFVAIAAQAVLHPVGGRSAYAAAKAGVLSLMNSVAEEGRPWKVRANTIVPSIVRTEANLAWADEDTAEGWVRPEQIADTILHLCSPTCAVSGASIPMYGTYFE